MVWVSLGERFLKRKCEVGSPRFAAENHREMGGDRASIRCGCGLVTSPFTECFLGLRDFTKLFQSSQA